MVQILTTCMLLYWIDESDSMGKFALDTEALDTDEDGEKEDEVPLELISVVDINLRDLIKPKLLV